MSNLSDWISWAAAQDAKGTLPDFATVAPQLTVPPLHDTPDANGLVALTGLDSTSHWAQFRYAIKEIGDSLPDGAAKQCVVANCTVAIGWYNGLGDIMACREVGTGSGLLNGPNIPNTYACPPINRMGNFLDTVAAATAHFRKIGDPATNTSFHTHETGA